MTSRLHQINVSHNTLEDRLLLRISTNTGEEFRMWLTRRYTSLLIGVLNKEIDERGGAPSVAGSEETTKMLKNGALEKKYEQEKIDNYPLGEEGVLAFRINARNTDKQVLILELLPQEGKGITLNLTKPLLFMFHNVLSQGIARASWALQTEQAVSSKIH